MEDPVFSSASACVIAGDGRAVIPDMKSRVSVPPRTCGFRFYPADAVILLLGLAATVALLPLAGSFALVIPAVLGHFFLFCNVFRIHRRLELIWTVVFVVNVVVWWSLDRFDWPTVLALQTPVTLGVITGEMRSPRYHGVLCRRINRQHLDDYLNGRY